MVLRAHFAPSPLQELRCGQIPSHIAPDGWMAGSRFQRQCDPAPDGPFGFPVLGSHVFLGVPRAGWLIHFGLKLKALLAFSLRLISPAAKTAKPNKGNFSGPVVSDSPATMGFWYGLYQPPFLGGTFSNFHVDLQVSTLSFCLGLSMSHASVDSSGKKEEEPRLWDGQRSRYSIGD